MMLRSRFAVVASLGLTLGLSLAACGGPDPVTQGKAAIQTRGCFGCHKADLAGATTPLTNTTSYPANLTPDKATGIGNWTDAQIKQAVLTGVDEEGSTLCPKMPRYATAATPMTDAEVTNIIAYLRSIPAVSQEIPASVCP